MEVSLAARPRYDSYSYRLRADVYIVEPDAAAQHRLREAAPLLRLERIEDRLRLLPISSITLLVNR